MRTHHHAAPAVRVVRVVLLVLAALLLLILVDPAGAAEAATGGGRAVVVDAADDGRPIAGGDSTTAFTLRLPEGAACPGDSEESQYRVQSFVVPAATDPGSLQYRGLRPVADGAWALYRTDTTTYMNAATNKAAEPGGEGAIINLPAFSFAVFEPGMITSGRYHLGIACSLFSETKRYWSVAIDVEADQESKPAEIAWRVVDPPAATGGGGSLPTPIVIALLLWLVAVPAAVFLWRRAGRDTMARSR